MTTTAFFLHPASALHDTGWGHPEHQGRLRALASTVGKDLLTLHAHVEQVTPRLATEEEILRVHTADHLERIREAAHTARNRKTLVRLDAGDTVVSAASWEAALGSAGAAVQAVEGIAAGAYDNAFIAARPPGHHATPDTAMGFCLFNSVAVAARHVQASGLGDRVLIIDWDVHHGNGTQDAFYDDPSVFYLSLHQWPHYPGTGAGDERGVGEGEGFTLNVPLPGGTSPESYRSAFDRALADVRAVFSPDFVLVSSGFDVLAGDPLGGQLLEPEDLHAMTGSVRELAAGACEGRLVVLLEGGYDPKRTGMGAVAVIRALAGLQAS